MAEAIRPDLLAWLKYNHGTLRWYSRTGGDGKTSTGVEARVFSATACSELAAFGWTEDEAIQLLQAKYMP